MLARSPEPAEALAHRCRDAIDQHAPAGEKENLLAVVQVLARLRYNDPRVFDILGGKRIMIESPLIDEIVSEAVTETEGEARHELIIEFLRARFYAVPSELERRIRSVQDKDGLARLTRSAATCRNLVSFSQSLDVPDRATTPVETS